MLSKHLLCCFVLLTIVLDFLSNQIPVNKKTPTTNKQTNKTTTKKQQKKTTNKQKQKTHKKHCS
jgi:flagellar biosynthesis component FlhA